MIKLQSGLYINIYVHAGVMISGTTIGDGFYGPPCRSCVVGLWYHTLMSADSPVDNRVARSVKKRKHAKQVIWFTLLLLVNTRKRGNCECIATWGRPSQASPFPL